MFAHDNSSPSAFYVPGAANWSSNFDGLTAVLWNPLIQAADANFGVQNNQFGFDIIGATNFSVVVEANANLAGAVWTAIQTLTLTNGLSYFSDPLF